MHALVLLAVLLGQTMGPRSGAVSWSGNLDGGVVDGGNVSVPFDVTWLPTSTAVYEGTASSNQIVFGTLTPGGCFVYFRYVPAGHSTATGTLCLQEGGNTPDDGFVNESCQTLDGGVGPFTWDVGPIHAPAVRMTYKPNGDDGGWIVGSFHTTE